MSWQDDPIVEAAPDYGAAGGDWWKADPVVKSDSVSRETVGKEVPLAVRPFVGANRMIAGMAGAPVDAVTWAVNKVGRGVQALTGEPRQDIVTDPIGGSESIKRAMGALPMGGANPDEVRPAETTAEKVLEGAGEGAAAMLVPGLGAEAILARTPAQLSSIATRLAKIIAGTGPASNVAIGAAGGATGEVAREAIPEGPNVNVGPLEFSREALREGAAVTGNIVGGGLAAGAQSGVEATGRATGRAIRAATEPAEMRAARTIMGRADDPGALRQAAQEASEAPALVPGSKPTTFQATGDLGVGALEREVAASQKGVSRFAGTREEQNSARLAELDKLQKSLPEDADPAAVAAAVQKRVQELETTLGERVAAARTQLDDAFRAGQLNEAEYGVALREAPIRLRTQLEQTEDALWAAVDPDRVSPFNPQTLKSGVDAIERAIPRTAKAAEGEERALFDVVKGLDESTTFGDITALRSRLTDELRDRTNTPTVRRRITLMLGEVDKALNDAGAMAPEVLDRYAAARGATRDVKSRFGEGTMGGILKEGDREGFRMTASNVAKNVFDRPEDLRAYLTAVGNDPAARATLEDLAAFSLRKAAVRDGMMSPSKYRQWIDEHDYVLQEFPDLRAKFGNIRGAASALDDALAAQKQALADYQSGAIKRLLNTQDPELVITNALRRPGEFETLAQEVAADPAARAGMKRAVIDYMMKQARSTAEAGTSGESQINAATLQKFFLGNKRSLSALFEPEELASIEAVTRDLQRANRSNVAVKIPGPGTAQDSPGALRSMFGQLMRHFGATAGGGAGSVFGPGGMVAGAAVGAVADALRVARVNSIDSALVEMMLDPKMAAIWLKRVPATEGEATASAFAQRLKALTAAQVMQAMEEEGAEPEPDQGGAAGDDQAFGEGGDDLLPEEEPLEAPAPPSPPRVRPTAADVMNAGSVDEAILAAAEMSRANPIDVEGLADTITKHVDGERAKLAEQLENSLNERIRSIADNPNPVDERYKLLEIQKLVARKMQAAERAMAQP